MDLLDQFVNSIWAKFAALVITTGTGYYFLKDKIKEKYRKLKSQIDPPDPDLGHDSPLSKFANDRREIKEVLKIRESFFGSDTITPDATYYNCWRQNADSFKLVLDRRRRPIGYWGMVPTNRDTYDLFLENVLTHSQILNTRVLTWAEAARHGCYLYIIGAVVPYSAVWLPQSAKTNKVRSAYVINDIICFSDEITSNLEIKGIFGYPSQDGGLSVLNKFGFQKNGKCISNDPKQPICFVPPEQVGNFIAKAKYYQERIGRYTPVWNRFDRDRFIKNLS